MLGRGGFHYAPIEFKFLVARKAVQLGDCMRRLEVGYITPTAAAYLIATIAAGGFDFPRGHPSITGWFQFDISCLEGGLLGAVVGLLIVWATNRRLALRAHLSWDP